MALNGYSVVWTEQAIANKEAIRQYLSKNWNQNVLQEFFRKLDERITLISRYPKLFQRIEGQGNTHRSVLTQQLTLYYKFDGQQVEILFLFDTRQDPDALNLQGR